MLAKCRFVGHKPPIGSVVAGPHQNLQYIPQPTIHSFDSKSYNSPVDPVYQPLLYEKRKGPPAITKFQQPFLVCVLYYLKACQIVGPTHDSSIVELPDGCVGENGGEIVMATGVTCVGHFFAIGGIVEIPTETVRGWIGFHFAEDLCCFVTGNAIDTFLVLATDWFV